MSGAKRTQLEEAEKRGRGRPPSADPRVKVTVRIKEALKPKLQRLGTEWLEAAVRRARDPDAG